MAENDKDNLKVWEYVEQLYKEDTDVREALLGLYNTEDQVKVFGSLAEGAFLARSISNGNMTIEVDTGTEIGYITEKMFNDSAMFVPLEEQGNPGFFNIKSCKELKNAITPLWRDVCETCFKDDGLFHHPSIAHIEITRGDGDAPEFLKDAHIEGPSVTSEYPFKSGNLIKMFNIVHGIDINEVVLDDITMSQDTVLCLKVNAWPSATTTTPTNESAFFAKSNSRNKWIKDETMTQILQGGFHVVPKSTNQSDGRIITSEWRLSFSQAEGILSDSLSEFQKKCYLVAKIIFTIISKRLKMLEGPKGEYYLLIL